MASNLFRLLSKTPLADSLAVYQGSRGSVIKKTIELCVFALALPVLGLLLFKQNPFALGTGFSWLAFLPVIFAARYGSLWGAACALLASAVFLLPIEANAALSGLVMTQAMIGMVALCVVVGDTSNGWRTRSRQSDAENIYLRHRLKEFSNDYHVLKVSHGHLEEHMAGQRMSLRQALQQIRPLLNTHEDGLEAGQELMAIFGQFCSVQVAGLYAMKSDTVINAKAVATIGNMQELPQFDPILKLALKTRQLVSVKLESHALERHAGGLLAVVPIVDSHGKLHGVLAVRDMHFMAFQQENLNTLSLLGGHIGDLLTRAGGVNQSKTANFLAELDNALRFARENSVQSSLVVLNLAEFEHTGALGEFLTRNIRSLDSAWVTSNADGQTSIVVLLPLVTEAQCDAYLRRVAVAVLEKFSLDFNDAIADVGLKQISRGDTRASCLAFISDESGGLQSDVTEETLSDTEVA